MILIDTLAQGLLLGGLYALFAAGHLAEIDESPVRCLHPEAAAAMGVSVEALESLLSRGRRALRLALADMVET